MKAWAIFVHSIRQVFGNLSEALHVSGLLYLLQMAVAVMVGVTPASMDPNAEVPPEQALAALAMVVVLLISTLWIAVAWHRFVLLGERPAGYIPTMSAGRLLRYGGRSLLIGLAVVVLALVLGLASSILVVPILGETPLAALISVLAMIVPGLAVLYRLSAALPGLALDRPTGFADGWVATTGDTATILILAFFTGLIGIVLGAPLRLMPQGTLVALLWELGAGWLQLMISASILTTLYGHYIEKRPLV